jgi:HEAT repeat protein
MARRLKNVKSDVVARLQFNAAEDPIAAVRRNALGTILKWQPVAAPTALRRALADPDWGVRYLAAQNAGRDGVPVLEAILLDEQVDTATRVDLIWTWASGAGQMQLLPHLPALFQSPNEAVRQAAIRATGIIGGADALKLLLSYPLTEAEVRPVAEAMAALGPDYETILLKHLETADGWRRSAISLALRQANGQSEEVRPLMSGMFEEGAPLADTARALADITANLNESENSRDEFQAWGPRKTRSVTADRRESRPVRSARR